MGQKIAGSIHDVDSRLMVFDPHMDVQSKDEIGAGYHFQILDDDFVALVRIDVLLAPICKRVSPRRGQLQTIFSGELDNF